MADGVAITAGSGTTIFTKDTGASGHKQVVTLGTGDANANLVPADTTFGLAVQPRMGQVRIAVNSGSLTTSVTAYTAGDQVGSQFTFAGAVRASGATGTLVGAVLLDKNDIIGAYDLVLTRSTITLASDNAAYAISDTDAEAVLGIIQFAGAFDIGNNRVAVAQGLAIPIDSATTDIFGGLICRTGHTFFTAATDLRVTLFIVQD